MSLMMPRTCTDKSSFVESKVFHCSRRLIMSKYTIDKFVYTSYVKKQFYAYVKIGCYTINVKKIAFGNKEHTTDKKTGVSVLLRLFISSKQLPHPLFYYEIGFAGDISTQCLPSMQRLEAP